MNEKEKTTPTAEPATEQQWTIVNKVDKQNDKIYRKFISA